jgi:hypothetical protein
MGDPGVATAERAAELVDELVAAQRVLAGAQAHQVALMLEFGGVRRVLDGRSIAEGSAEGVEARFRPGEFAAMEIGLAVKASKFSVQRTMAVAARLQAETPDAWDAWSAGEIDQPKAVRISRTLLRLTRESSKQMLNATVVPVAVCRTAELLGRWLNQFVARVEPDQVDERLRRSFGDRYVSLRPDLDGMSALSAALSSVDAVAVDQVLNALAGLADPDDERTVMQRRADALVDLLLGRASNGCHVTWQDDDEDETENDDDDTAFDDYISKDDDTGADDPAARLGDVESSAAGADPPGGAEGRPWDPDADFDLPPSAFRPDRGDGSTADPPAVESAGVGSVRANGPPDPDRPGRAVVTRCPGGQESRPLPRITIGVVVSVQSLFGYSDAPGQLADRSALVPAETIRELAGQPGTLFYRLLTDAGGDLLSVTELGRFPSRKLGVAVRMREGVCGNPVCTVPVPRCDLDHLVPVPHGPTAACNLGPKCRGDHRAKTHAGHRSTRTGPHTTRWQTPTGHTYDTRDTPLPVENWPGARGDGSTEVQEGS